MGLFNLIFFDCTCLAGLREIQTAIGPSILQQPKLRSRHRYGTRQHAAFQYVRPIRAQKFSNPLCRFVPQAWGVKQGVFASFKFVKLPNCDAGFRSDDKSFNTLLNAQTPQHTTKAIVGV